MRIFLLISFFVFTTDCFALKHWKPRKVKAATLEEVCPEIQEIGTTFFWKNNKPIRAGSAINAPVIGNNPVMTLAGQPGKGKGLFNSSGGLYDSNGKKIASMASYPCRSDHCGGRVVSNMQTAAARRAAVKSTDSPVGYVKIGRGSKVTCVRIPDIGACFGNHVDKSRPLCDRTLK